MYTQVKKDLQKLEKVREAICYQLIEATGNKVKRLESRLQIIEEQIELKQIQIEDIETIKEISDEYN